MGLSGDRRSSKIGEDQENVWPVEKAAREADMPAKICRVVPENIVRGSYEETAKRE